jgi:hypothetical protein
MSRGPETRFIKSVHRLMPTDLYHMKNHNTYVGGPADVWYSGKRGDMWIEYKYVHKLPAIIDLMDTKKKYSLSGLQQEWCRDRLKEGRNVIVILGCKEGGVVFHALEWEQKWNTENWDKEIESRQEIAIWISETTKGSYEAPVRRGKGLERCV